MVAADAHVQGGLPGHAGAFETSLVLALQPGLVREPRPHRADATGTDPRGARRPYRAESHGSWQGFDGYTDSPDRGTAERGRAYLAAAVRAVGRAFVEFHTATGGRRLA